MSLRYPARFKPSTSLGRFSDKTGCGAAGGGVTRGSGGAEGASVGLADSVVVGGFFLHAANGSVAATRKTTAMARDQFLFIPVSFSLSGRAIQRARAKKHAIQRARAKKHASRRAQNENYSKGEAPFVAMELREPDRLHVGAAAFGQLPFVLPVRGVHRID